MQYNEFEKDVVYAKFLKYMQQTLLHKKINYIKKRERIKKKECSIDDLSDYLKYEDTIKFDILDFLTPKERKILELHIIEKRTYEEISKIFNLKPESIRKIKYRAIIKIKKWRNENGN